MTQSEDPARTGLPPDPPADLKTALWRITRAGAEIFAQHPGAIGQQLSARLRDLRIRALRPPGRTACAAPSFPVPATPGEARHLERLGAGLHLLHWRRPGYGALPAEISDSIAVVEIVGPDGMIDHPDLRFGMLHQGANHFYPEHNHAAEELYFVISGAGHWGREGGKPMRHSAGTFIHHPPWIGHSITTVGRPMLAFWGWTGEITSSAYRLAKREV